MGTAKVPEASRRIPTGRSGRTAQARAVRNTYDSATGLLSRVEQGNVSSAWIGLGLFSPSSPSRRPTIPMGGGGRQASLRLHRPRLSQTSYDRWAAGMLGAADEPACVGSACPAPAPSVSREPPPTITARTEVPGPFTMQPPGDPAQDRARHRRRGERGYATYTANGLVQTVTDGESNKTAYDMTATTGLTKTYFPMPNPRARNQQRRRLRAADL